MSISTNSQGLFYIGIIISIELVSSSARVTSVKFHKVLGGREVQRPGPIDRTPETPGSGKKLDHLIMAEVLTSQYLLEVKPW